MAYIAHDSRLVPEVFERAQASKAPKPSLWSKFLNALMESRRIAAEREIGRYVASHGGMLTDEVEREIGRRFETNAF
jgi:hypothetical protein